MPQALLAPKLRHMRQRCDRTVPANGDPVQLYWQEDDAIVVQARPLLLISVTCLPLWQPVWQPVACLQKISDSNTNCKMIIIPFHVGSFKNAIVGLQQFFIN